MSAVVARARACLGARFRPQGRDPVLGLDCVGLAGVAFQVAVPGGYARRSADLGRVQAAIMAAELEPGAMAPGALLLCATGPGQLHLAIVTDTGFVHADAMAGRVVERPGAPPWPVLGAWRRKTEE